jgi:acyl-coenzyme A thioesterase PaaI-like protein
MVREIENVFLDFPGYRCFACDPGNDLGLKLRFFADDEKGEVFTRIRPDEHFSGFPGILHGGIQCALVDEVAFWTMFDKLKRIGVTVRVEMDFLSPVRVSSFVEIRGKLEKVVGKRVFVDVNVLNGGKEVCTRSKVIYYLPQKEVLFGIMGRERFSGKFLKYVGD